MLRSLGFTLSLAVLAATFAFAPVQAQSSQTRALVTRAVDNSQRVTLAGNTVPMANAANDRGAVADSLAMDHLQLLLQRPPEVEKALVQLIDQMHDRNSPNFQKWLTAAEFGQKFGPAQSDVKAVTDWLKSQGFTVNFVYPNNIMIDFSGTAGKVRQAFGTEIHNLNINGQQHVANMRDPQIPAALAGVVKGIVSLNDFKPHPLFTPRPQYTISASTQALVPADLATIYNFNPLFTGGTSGQGQTIVVIEDTDVYTTADWTTFRSTFGLSSFTSGSFVQVHPAPAFGPNNCGAPGVLIGNDAEAILDAEWASAGAPSAKIELAACRDTRFDFGGLLAFNNLVNSFSPPAVVSISYGFCEAFLGASGNAEYYNAYQQAAAEGVSVFVSSGDEGAASCDANQSFAVHGIGVSGFTSTPYNVSVGGTDFGDRYANAQPTYWNSSNTSTFGSAKSYIPEIPWNDSCASLLYALRHSFSQTYGSSGWCNNGGNLTTASGSGGPSNCATGAASTPGVASGTCAGYAKPSWQSVLGNPSDSVRDIPDVSLFASNGFWGHYYVVCYSDRLGGGNNCRGAPSTWAGFGGTSISSPIMAGIQALVNQRKHARTGNPNPRYYQLAATEYGNSGSASCNSSNGNAVGSSCTFYDVTLGDMDVPCRADPDDSLLHNCYLPSGTNGVLSTSNSSYQPAYGTTTGWDFATGIGTVNATNLVNNF